MPSHRSSAAVLTCCAFVAAAALGLVFVRSSPDSHDSGVMVSVTKSIVERHDFRTVTDWLGRPIPEQKYGLGMSLLFAGPYAVGRALDIEPIHAAMTTNAFVFAGTVVALMALARLLDASWGQTLVATFLVAAGTILLPLVPTGFSELAVAATVALGLVAVSGASKGRRWAPLLAGAAAGAATLLRTDSLVLILPVIGLAVLVAAPDWRTLVGFGAGAAPFLVAWGWYNAIRYGAPWSLGYYEDEGFTHPFVRGLYGLLLSPGRGLLWYVPLVALALVGFRWAWRRNRVVAGAAALLFLARPLFYASWYAWSGGWGWGPRFLAPAMPALMVPIVEIVRRWRSWHVVGRLVATVVVLGSLSVQVVGASTDYLPWNAAGLARKAAFDDYLFSWEYFPILEQGQWMFTRPEVYVGWALPPTRRPVLFTALIGTSLVMGLLAERYARALDRRMAARTPGRNRLGAQPTR